MCRCVVLWFCKSRDRLFLNSRILLRLGRIPLVTGFVTVFTEQPHLGELREDARLGPLERVTVTNESGDGVQLLRRVDVVTRAACA